MNFAFSEEQEAFRELVTRFVTEHCPLKSTRRLFDTKEGHDAETWRRMARELGLQGLLIAPEHGGQGFTMLELGLALEALGRQLAGGPFFASAVLATLALQNMATPAQQAEFLPPLARGDAIATAALGAQLKAQPDGDTDDGGDGRDGAAAGDATDAGDGAADGAGADAAVTTTTTTETCTITGRVPWLQDAQNARWFFLATGDALFAVEAHARGVEIAPAPTLDLTRRYAHVHLRAAPARRLGAAPRAQHHAALARTRWQATIALGAEQVGAAAQCLDAAVAYVKERVQFGRALGSFQAIKHRAADAYRELELARSAAYWAWWVVATGNPELPLAAHTLGALANEAARLCAYENIHLHGGYGFTWEHDAHLYYRRAAANAALFGAPTAHHAALWKVLAKTAAPAPA